MDVTNDLRGGLDLPRVHQQTDSTPIDRTLHFLRIVSSEVWANIRHVIPQAVSWQWRQRVQNSIVYQAVNIMFRGANRLAALYLHQPPQEGKTKGMAVLFLHGDHSHPFTTLHLADVAQQVGAKHVYSLHLNYNDEQSKCHQGQLQEAIKKVAEAVTATDGSFKGVILVGHSRGAVEAAYLAYAEQDPSIKAIISIAGRFKVTPPPDRPPRESLAPTIEAIEQAITADPPDNLYQIAASDDWCIPEDASLTVADKEKALLIEDSSHLNVLFNATCVQQVRQWLELLLV